MWSLYHVISDQLEWTR